VLDRREIIRLPEDVFRLLRDLISDYCGIYFDDSSKYLVERRLSRRVRIHGLDDFRDYYRFLLYDRRSEEELSDIIDILTVNETYFFREQNQLKAFIDEICVELKELRKDSMKLRVWSAGCSSGEEPYTIAMLILEKPQLFGDWDIEIVGSDINQRVLHIARKGAYRKNSFRTTDEYYLKKYFRETEDGFEINDVVKKLVNFNCLNLLDPFKTRFVGAMDVIFCRNVLIYFHTEAKKKLIDNFYHRLSDGGYLLLGHAESLMNVSTAFTLKHFRNDMVYQKPRKTAVTMSDDSLIRMVWGR
jgi:chemotaxis protein methyltransferase CheR